MKLYTEEQVRQAIQITDKYHYLLDSEQNEIVNSLTPIQLPSDEEIDEDARSFYSLESNIQPFSEGVKHLRNKIQGGDK